MVSSTVVCVRTTPHLTSLTVSALVRNDPAPGGDGALDEGVSDPNGKRPRLQRNERASKKRHRDRQNHGHDGVRERKRRGLFEASRRDGCEYLFRRRHGIGVVLDVPGRILRRRRLRRPHGVRTRRRRRR